MSDDARGAGQVVADLKRERAERAPEQSTRENDKERERYDGPIVKRAPSFLFLVHT